jgi:hypothetical protein
LSKSCQKVVKVFSRPGADYVAPGKNGSKTQKHAIWIRFGLFFWLFLADLGSFQHFFAISYYFLSIFGHNGCSFFNKIIDKRLGVPPNYLTKGLGVPPLFCPVSTFAVNVLLFATAHFPVVVTHIQTALIGHTAAVILTALNVKGRFQGRDSPIFLQFFYLFF